MSVNWQTFNFSEFLPVKIDNLVPGNSYIVLSTSQDIYPNGRWVITVQSYAAIDPYNPFGYADVTITNSTEPDFITILNSHNPNMVFTTNDRAFYNEGIVRIDNYLKSYNKLFPVELIEELASY
jgi:hypothetical protein